MKKQTITKKSVRLSKNVAPLNYAITLEPDLEAHTFAGEETITLSIVKKTKEITLHSADLEISSVRVMVGKNIIVADAISYDEKAETVTFAFESALPVGKVKLHIVFAGILKDTMRGFYKSNYIVDGMEKVLATTQFEATDARRCIPCFDEPALKATFEVSLIIPPDKTAISNTLPTTVREHASGAKIVSFAPTPKMSTYLLAFIVGDFEYLEEKTKRGVAVRVFTTPGKKEQGRFALECAVRTLDLYEEYFDIKYPLPTLDMIAIPDFASGAMENWGAVTYRESALLVDDEQTSASTRQWVALVVAHELAHQWFGNLVTMEWWTHLWLNEGFASYIEYLAVDKLFPQWNIWSQFMLQDHGVALRLDALLHTHPIEVDVAHPDEISEIFDEVSYSKGASVIRMLAGYLGEKNFRDGLRYYLKKHSYKNTETVHLWEAFEKVSKLPVQKMMKGWTRTSGYPVLSVEQKGKNVRIVQERFFMSPLSAKKVQKAQTWMVPFSVRTETQTQSYLMSTKQFLFPYEEGWMKVNTEETGLYHVSYPAEVLSQLQAPVAEKKLSALDRLGIIRDLFALAESGQQSVTMACDFVSAYTDEDEYIVWGEVLAGLAKIHHVFASSVDSKKIKKYILSVVIDKALEVGWEKKTGESHERTLLRSALLHAAGRYGHRHTVEEAFALFNNRNETPLHPDIRGVVYALVAEYGTMKEYDELISLYKDASLHEEKNRISRALSYCVNKKQLARTLSFALSDQVRFQDAPILIAYVMMNPFGTELAWTFVQKNWKELLRRYGTGGHMLTRMIAPLSSFTDKNRVKEIQQFFKKNPALGAARTIEQTIEKIQLYDAWKKRDTKKLEACFKKQQ